MAKTIIQEFADQRPVECNGKNKHFLIDGKRERCSCLSGKSIFRFEGIYYCPDCAPLIVE